jgi:hypothetical protein
VIKSELNDYLSASGGKLHSEYNYKTEAIVNKSFEEASEFFISAG